MRTKTAEEKNTQLVLESTKTDKPSRWATGRFTMDFRLSSGLHVEAGPVPDWALGTAILIFAVGMVKALLLLVTAQVQNKEVTAQT